MGLAYGRGCKSARKAVIIPPVQCDLRSCSALFALPSVMAEQKERSCSALSAQPSQMEGTHRSLFCVFLPSVMAVEPHLTLLMLLSVGKVD